MLATWDESSSRRIGLSQGEFAMFTTKVVHTRSLRNLSLAAGGLVALVAASGATGLACSRTPVYGTAPVASPVAHFEAQKGHLPEGLALRGSKAYVGFGPTRHIMEVKTATPSCSLD